MSEGEDVNTLGKRLRWCREKRHWSQLDVSRMIGISNMSISNYERGDRQPDLHALVKFSDLYGVSIDWLVTGREWQAERVTDLHELLNVEASYKNVALSPVERQRVLDFLAGMLWDRLS